MSTKPIYSIGDKVKIVNYGALIWYNKKEWKKMYDEGFVTKLKPDNIIAENNTIWTIDIMPKKVGEEAIIQKVNTATHSYSLKGKDWSSAWYNEDQLEMINKNPNTI